MFKWLLNKKNKGEKKMATIDEVRKLYEELSDDDKAKFEESLSAEESTEKEKIEEQEGEEETNGDIKALFEDLKNEITSLKAEVESLKKSPREVDNDTSKNLNELQSKYEN